MSHFPRAPRALVSRPNLEQIKKQARELLKAVRNGVPEAEARIRAEHPRFAAPDAKLADFALTDAQLVLAREYGQPSFPALKAEVEARRRARSVASFAGALPLLELGELPFCPYSELVVQLMDARALAAVAAAVAADGLAACTLRPPLAAAAVGSGEGESVAALVRVVAVRESSRGQTAVTLLWLARATVAQRLPGAVYECADITVQAEPPFTGAQLRAAVDAVSDGLEQLAHTVDWLSVPALRALRQGDDLGRLLALAAPHCPGLAHAGARQRLDRAALVAEIQTALARAFAERTAVAIPAPPNASANAEAYLVVLGAGVHPHLRGRRYPLAAAVTTIGRGDACDVILHGDAVSRVHARIEREGEDFVVVDSASTNGTFVGNESEPATSRRLCDGDELTIGDAVLRFVKDGDLDAKYRAALDYASQHDALSRSLTRQAWSVDTERAILGARASGAPLAVLLVKVEELAALRERSGQLYEIATLRVVSAALRELAGAEACVGRYAEHELVLTLPGFGLREAEAAGRELCRRLAEGSQAYRGEALRPSVTFGVATLYSSTGLPELLDDAVASRRRAQSEKRQGIAAA